MINSTARVGVGSEGNKEEYDLKGTCRESVKEALQRHATASTQSLADSPRYRSGTAVSAPMATSHVFRLTADH
ncbi:hypothetical protein Q7P35_009480 [Cladosporium inversicolor]